MKQTCSLIVLFMMMIIIVSCSKQEAPLDSNGKTPQQILLETFVLITEGKYDEAKNNYSPDYIKEFISGKDLTFVEFHTNKRGIDTTGWEVKWLKSNLIGNDYNDNVWRAEIVVDEGKGSHNRPGVVHDFYLIDGVWKIVFWNHYPKKKA